MQERNKAPALIMALQLNFKIWSAERVHKTIPNPMLNRVYPKNLKILVKISHNIPMKKAGCRTWWSEFQCRQTLFRSDRWSHKAIWPKIWCSWFFSLAVMKSNTSDGGSSTQLKSKYSIWFYLVHPVSHFFLLWLMHVIGPVTGSCSSFGTNISGILKAVGGTMQ